MKTITDDVQRYLNGEGEYEGRPVLVTNNDFRVTTGQIYSRLCQDEQFGFAVGRGLVKLGSDQQWRPLSFEEWQQAILGIFTLAKLQEGVSTLTADFKYAMSGKVISITYLGTASIHQEIGRTLRRIEHWHQGSVKSFRILYQDADGLGCEVKWDGENAEVIGSDEK